MAISRDQLQDDPVVPDDDEVIVFPVSFAQQRLWFLEQLTPGGSVYNIPLAIRVTGKLDIPVLERALGEVINRHETLRTGFSVDHSQAVQLISPARPLPLPLTDLSQLTATEREQAVQRLATEEAERSFDLTKAPLLRARVLRLTSEEYVLLFTMHHIVSDGWSMGVLFKEVATLYSSFLRGEASPLDELPIQYADYAVWQREYLSGDLLEEQVGYWRNQLAGVPPVLALPIDHPRPTIQSYRGSAVKVSLDAETASAMRELSRREGVTLFMLLLAAFDVLLWRWTSETDVVVGTPIANRTRAELEGLIGFFVNTLPLRVRLAGNPSFRELLNKVREVCLGAYSHQELPFEKLVEEIAPERNLSHTPLFQVMLILQNAPLEEIDLPGLKLSILETENSTSKFDLQLALGETETGVHGSLQFNTDLFERATVQRLAAHLATLLESAIANPDQRIAELPLLTPAERHQLLDEWNDASQEHPSQRLHELFERQVERAPDDTALVLAKEKLSYRELNRRANQLAHYLRALSVGPESLVAVVMERSLEMIVSVLGVLKAGAAYLPVDPAYPKDRISFMLEDAAVSVLITTDALRGTIGEQEAVRIVCLDTEWTTIASHHAHNPHVDGNTDNLAYVIYTSGSTGKPKGVMVSHGNVVRLFSATEKWFRFSADDVWTLFHSYAFDFSVWEMWGAFLYGGRLIVVPYLVSRSPDSFYELLCREQVTVLNQTPTAFRQLIRAEQEIGEAKSLALRLVILGGEALEPGSLRPWFDRHGDQFPQLVNMYGITETTVHVTYRPLLAADAHANGRSVVGVRISDLELYLLDEHLELTPLGVTGEVYVGGGGLARGYLHRPELTAERFIPHPFSREAGSRLYRTGDLARLHPDGDLEYLGRADQQVKIRGFRIELGEIETVLQSHPGIQQVTVAASGSATGEQRLVAYVTARNQHSPSTNDLERYLRQRLPEYMIPAAFVFLDSLPLTASGKVDRRALPAPDARRPAGQESYCAPRTPTEQAMASAWAEVLGLERVGIHDNFFSLGGDSIRTIQVRSKAQERGLDFSLQQLFQYQTIAELSDQISSSAVVYPVNLNTKKLSLVSEADLKQLPADVEDAYPVARLQIGMLFHAAYDSQVTIYHNVNSFELRAPFDLKKLETCLRQLAARHPILRTSFELGRFSEPLQLVHKTVEIPLQIEDLRELSAGDQNEIISKWFAVERSRPFNIREAPLLRFHIHRRSDDTFQFSFTEHHAILDGWSVASMLTELFRSYSTLLEGREDEIDAPLSTFRDFVASERFALASLEHQRYWEQKLKSSTMTTLPRSPARPGNEIARGRTRHNLVLSPEVSEGLHRLSQDEGIPLKSLLLAAHVRVLSLCSGRTDVVTGLVSNGRLEEPDGDRVLGLFLNNLPFRLEFRGGTWLELVRQTFEVERELLAFRHYPLSELQRARRHPLFETVFNFVHFHIYESITGSADFELLGARTFGETEAPFVADFGMNSGSRQVELRLSGHANEFSAAQLEAIGNYYLNALASIAHDAHGSSESQMLLSAPESHKILVQWNDTRTDYPPPRTAHELFEAQVTLTPDSPALVFGREQLSYWELNERANQLAHHLRALGARPEMLIGIMMERSMEMVISVLAVLKAGAAFVPFDPSYPRERLSFMLEDAGVSVLLTQDRLRDLMASSRIKIICPDSERAVIEEQSRDNPPITVSGGNLAYVIYTSGSTGQPKGVMVTHRSLCNLAHAQTAAFHLSTQERVLQFASPSFDASVSELFKTFLAGGTLCLAHKNGLFPGPELLEVLQDQRITTVTLPPSALRALPVIELPDLRRLILAGEACRAKEVRTWQQSGRRLFNAYGPTEATVCATVYECEGAAESPPIGRPIANVEVYVLDEQLQPVPVGTTGELYIGGLGVARGYWHRPEQTAEHFIPHLYSRDAGARLYRTGDLARYLPDGNLEYLGRDDEQVKIRGFRIELAEVEIALREHPSVRECAVLAPQDETGEKRLAAYIVGQAGPQTTLGALRRYLQERLPEPMIPSSFVMLEEMPLTVAGKIDRRALTEADGLRPELDEEYVAPGTDLERALATMWQATLGVERVGIHDNFFEIGGDSIRGAVLVNRLQEALGEYVYIVALFDAPTIAELTAYLNRHYADAVRRMCPSGSAKPIETEQISHGPEEESGETVLAARKMKPIAAVPRNQGLPLSFAQQRLWFLDQLAPGSAAYNVPLVVSFTGALDINALRQTLNEVLRRHETLRTSFAVVGSQPVQVIAAPHPFDLPLVDLSDREPGEREQILQQLSAAEATQPFDLTVSPLLRARLLRLSMDEHVVLFTMHHIITDGWSMGVLTREVAALYTAFAARETSPLPELPIQYADYAAWQREQLRGVLLEEQLKYWRAQLSGAPPVLELPTDKPRPLVQSYHGGEIGIELEKETVKALGTLSRNEGMTLFMVLLAAFDVLLWRRSGQEEIVVGSPVAGRTRSELEGLIGFFVNTLALRVRVEGNLTFRDLLGRVKEAALGAYAHQEVPFEKVVEELATERDLSHTPVFQVMLMLQNLPREELDLPGLKLAVAGSDNASVKFDLSLILVDGEQGIAGWLRYDVNLFEEATIKRMIEHWELVLKRAVTSPEKRLSELSLLPNTEQHQVLYDWNNTQCAYPWQCIHEVFEEQVQRTPNATAVIFEDQQLTYAELNARANQLGHYLRTLGIGPEVLVAICMERSIEMVVAILGVLKAGGAYLPLDPTYPLHRLSFMLEDTSAPVLLTQEKLSDGLPAHWGQTICLDTEWCEISEQPAVNPERTVSPDNLAYVIYTSGSTGTPKGVLIEHFSVANLARAQARAFHLSTDERVLQFASFSFDASVSELFKTLCAGGTLCLATKLSLLPGIELLNILEHREITTVTLPPSALKALPAGDLPRLQKLIVAGEACRGEELERWAREDRRIFNAYGPTEATVCASVYEYQRGEETPPIGKPISNAQVYVLDEQMQVVPIGVIGQLYIGGMGVARGYLRRPEQTADRFTPDPFVGRAGARMYRTGDMGRWLASGQLEYVGREDEQVKVRGHRIELGEVEAVLREHAAIRDAVVTMKEDAAGEKRLIAYVVASEEEQLNVTEVRRHLGQRLPGYMTPSSILKIAELPLTENGKVDRRALPEPAATRPELAEEYVAPRTELERKLADIFEEVVGIDKMGVHDNFFDVGGDSIKGAVIINRLQEELSEFVHVVALFDAPNIAQLAAYLTEHFPEEVLKFCGDEGLASVHAAEIDTSSAQEQVSARAIDEVRQLIVPLKLHEQSDRAGHAKNPSAIFVLSPPRSGSTLLRVMLGGHPALFAPPELELLSFNTLAERRTALSGRYSFWLEGTLRALMQAKGCTAEQAKALMDECEARQMSTREFYRLLQEWIPDRRLVDKTPSYALDEQVLQSAEVNFENALYIHLVRHPQAMIRSFAEARLEQVFFRYSHTLDSRALAEALWVICHENIARFLATIPAKRKHVVKFEELVESPAESVRVICDFLEIEPVSAMLEPYKETRQRMTDGIHPLSKMLGDVKFHEHKGIEREVADRWKQDGQARLSGLTWRLAESLGYHRDGQPRSEVPTRKKQMPAHFVALQPDGVQTPLFCVHSASGHVYSYIALARCLGPDQPVYGIQSPSLFESREPFTTVTEMAAYYVESLLAFQPQGPYLLAGHSSGGHVAFEMAQILVRQGQKVSLLALFDTEAVSSSEVEQRKAEVEHQDDAILLAGMLRYSLPLSLEHLQRLNSEERLLYIIDLAKQHQLIPPDFQLAQARHFMQTLRANIEASASYVPEKYIGAVTLFRASVRDVSEVPDGETLGWGSVATGGVELHMVPGNHVTMIAQPNVQALAELLANCLQRAADK